MTKETEEIDDSVDGKREITVGSFAKWLSGFSLLGIVGAIVLFQSFWKNSTSIADREIELQAKRDAEVADAAIAINRAQLTEERADYAHWFSKCWPTGGCGDITQLPVDDDQDAAIESIIQELQSLKRRNSKHCQDHRDAGNQWDDCF